MARVAPSREIAIAPTRISRSRGYSQNISELQLFAHRQCKETRVRRHAYVAWVVDGAHIWNVALQQCVLRRTVLQLQQEVGQDVRGFMRPHGTHADLRGCKSERAASVGDLAHEVE